MTLMYNVGGRGRYFRLKPTRKARQLVTGRSERYLHRHGCVHARSLHLVVIGFKVDAGQPFACREGIAHPRGSVDADRW